ncbi:MAG: hypothetical protein CVV51_03205 [Spirochaetae bacterium HGW-Spirochaetae-7]|nr:MAG: hypothetical protein CVV51_03205 [Spirochaetae bacterium HGW-Spirochaetae-7]
MRRIALVLAACAAVTVHAQTPWNGRWEGRWEGSLELADGRMPFGLSIVEGGALLDLPGAELFAYPSVLAQASPDAIRLSFAFGAGAMTMIGTLSLGRVDGQFRQGSGDDAPGGTFSMQRAAVQPDPKATFRFAGHDGVALSGSLLVPADGEAGRSKPPLVIMHAGLGAADRDGNNYNMPGRNDSLRLLAEALAARGVATYRYDKRGAGVSSWLVPTEDDQSIEAWIEDLEAASTALSGTGRWSGVWLLGLNDGAIVAAAAANGLSRAGRPVAGIVVACASADGPLDAFMKAVAAAPEIIRAEGDAIIAGLLAGRRVESMSAFYSGAFRPGIQPYLIEAFKRDLEPELSMLSVPALIAQGDMDMQVTLADFVALGTARPDALTVIVPRMNHLLKDVSQDVEENMASFSDPSYPVSAIFADAVAEFVASP